MQDRNVQDRNVADRDLELFLHLAGTLNFGRTSVECHLSPATLTRTVQRLEARVGTRLFDRGPHGVALTGEGDRFRGYARRALELWQDYRAGAEPPGEKVDLAGELRLFATVTACQTLVPRLLAPLRAAHPRIRLDLRTGDASAALARVDEGEVDAALAGLPARLPHALISRTVTVTDLVLVCPRGHEEQADAGPFVVPRRGPAREAADRWLRSRALAAHVAVEAEGHESLLALVALGYGTGIVPRLVLEASPAAGALTVARADLAPFPIGLCVRRDDVRRPLVGALWSATAPGATTDGWSSHRDREPPAARPR